MQRRLFSIFFTTAFLHFSSLSSKQPGIFARYTEKKSYVRESTVRKSFANFKNDDFDLDDSRVAEDLRDLRLLGLG